MLPSADNFSGYASGTLALVIIYQTGLRIVVGYLFLLLLKIKGVYSSSLTDLRATGRHLPYGITPCYLPLDTSECAPP